jgi:hypothetical protein
MNRTAITAEIAAVAGFQLALAALLRHATARATQLETEAFAPATAVVPGQRPAS